jgi:hypothetical protein
VSTRVSKYISLGQKLSAAQAPSENTLGGCYIEADMLVVNGQRERYLSNMDVCCRLCKNTGATPIEPGSGVKPTSGNPALVSQAAAGDPVTGVADPYLTSDIAVGEVFLAIVDGPGKVKASAAVALGDLLQVGAAGDFSTSAGPVAPNTPARAMEVGAAAGLVRSYINCKAGV